jgi:hypothetical protein
MFPGPRSRFLPRNGIIGKWPTTEIQCPALKTVFAKNCGRISVFAEAGRAFLGASPPGVPLVPVVLSVSSAIRALSFPRLAGRSWTVETPRKIRRKSLSNPKTAELFFTPMRFSLDKLPGLWHM